MTDFSTIRDKNSPPNYKVLIDGEWTYSNPTGKVAIISPIDKSTLGFIQEASQEDINLAVTSSYSSQKDWANAPLYKRVDLMLKVADLLEKNKDIFKELLILEIGKPEKEADEEIARTVDLIRYYAEEARRVTGEYLQSDAYPNTPKNRIAIVKRVPLGIVLAIPPFNYPLNETAPKVISALVSGNSVILKPPTQGAITNLHFAHLFYQAGLPKGVLSVLTGPGSKTGNLLVSNDLISAINFTGSYKTAETITKLAGVKKLIFGLSGKDASIVLKDADLDLAASEISSGGFSYAGQRCTGIKRVFVEEEVADNFVKKLVANVRSKFILGDPREEKSTLGPIINDETAKYVEELIDDAKLQGAQVVLGGRREQRYMEATILDYVTEHMRISWEEPFGPVLPVIRIKNYKEALKSANQSQYGLQSSVFTRDIDLALKIADELEVGSVQINSKDARGPDHFPFLGIKHSGLGMVQGAKYLLSEMTRIKTIVIRIQE